MTILILVSVISTIAVVTTYTSSSNEEPIDPDAGKDMDTLSMNFIEISTGLPSGQYSFVDFGNFNGDSYIDMAFGGGHYGGGGGTNEGVYAYIGDGGTSWTDTSANLPTTSTFGGLAFGDADNDGNMDLFAAYEHWGSGPNFGVGAWEYDGLVWSTTGINSPYTTGTSDNIILKNITGDSGLDLLVATEWTGLRYWEGSGSDPVSWFEISGGFVPFNEYTALAVEDMNKDGRPDIVSGTYDGLGIKFFTQDVLGGGWTERPNGLPSFSNILGIAVGDVNNDTHMDIVYGSQNGGLSILLGNSGGITGTDFNWTNPSSPNEGIPTSALTGTFTQILLADFDKDGDLDLLAPKTNIGGGLHLYLGNGSVSPGENFGFTELLGAGLPTSGVFYGSNYADIDNDGDLDIAGTMWGGGGARAWLNNLTIVPDTTPPYALTFSPTGVGVPIDTNFVVEWNETMDWTSVETSFSYTDSITVWDETDGTFTHNPITRTSTFDPTVSLSYGTTYTVTFDTTATDPAGNPLDQDMDGTGGEIGFDEQIWQFTTEVDTPPTIEAWEPGGTAGQIYIQGQMVPITWDTTDNLPLPANPINITYGDTISPWITIATNEIDDGNYLWDTLGVSCPDTYWMNLTVYDSSGQEVFDVGNNSFDIICPDSPPTIEAWEPGGTTGQTYTQGDMINVTWDANDNNPLPLNPINITYGVAPAWVIITTDEADDGIYYWDTTTVPCPGTYWMNISVYDDVSQTTFDESNYSFDIFCPGASPPTITAFEPGGSLGQSYTQGEIIDITWAANDDEVLPATPINITYGSAPLWATIATDEPDDGIFSWDTSTVPCPGTYWMNLSVYDSLGQTTFDESNYSFEINCVDTPPTIEVWEPGGLSSQAFTQGDIVEVTWTADDDIALPLNPINITYGTTGSWITLSTLESDDGTYNWNTSSVPCSNQYRMNLSVFDSGDQTTFDESNYSFTINCPTGNITVYVTDELDDSIEGASITLMDSSSTIGTGTTDTNGEYSFLNVGQGVDEYTIIAEKEFYESAIVENIDVDAGLTTDVFIVLQSNGSISGRIVDDNGDPIESATVILLDEDGNTIKTVTTDSDGSYEFTEIEYGSYSLYITATGYNPETTDTYAIDEDNLEETISDIALTPLTIEPPPDEGTDWLWLILIIIVIVVVVLILLLLLFFRKKKKEEQVEPSPLVTEEESPGSDIKD